MQHQAGFYKRRLPWIGQVLAPVVSPLVSATTVVARPPARRPGVVLFIRPPFKLVPPPAVRPLPNLVVTSRTTREGRVIWLRPLLKAPPANVAGAVRPARVFRSEPHLRLREGRAVLTRLPGPPTAPPTPGVLRWTLRASAATVMSLKASARTSWALKASMVMSISAKLNFFQGEDVTLNFSMTPPQDITGWTLTGTVKNSLGGTTQFTFTPTILDTGRGVFQAVWARVNTTNLSPGDYVWDIRRTDSNNNTVLAHGEITVKQPVTA